MPVITKIFFTKLKKKIKLHLLCVITNFNGNYFSDDLLRQENKVASTKMSLSTDEEATFDFGYSINGSNSDSKKMNNKFLSELILDTEDPQQVNVIISSPNFNVVSYPSNSKQQ